MKLRQVLTTATLIVGMASNSGCSTPEATPVPTPKPTKVLHDSKVNCPEYPISSNSIPSIVQMQAVYPNSDCFIIVPTREFPNIVISDHNISQYYLCGLEGLELGKPEFYSFGRDDLWGDPAEAGAASHIKPISGKILVIVVGNNKNNPQDLYAKALYNGAKVAYEKYRVTISEQQ